MFWKFYFSAFYKPSYAFSEFANSRNIIKYAFAYILIPIIGYTLMYVFLAYANGAPSVFTPWLNIPKESYYYYNQFLLAPSILLSWFACSVFMHLLSKLFGSDVNFDITFAAVALAISIAMWGTLVHDLIMSFSSAMAWINPNEHEIAMNSPTIWRTLLWISISIYLFAFLFYFYIVSKSIHKLKKLQSITISFLSFLVFQIIFLIFNR